MFLFTCVRVHDGAFARDTLSCYRSILLHVAFAIFGSLSFHIARIMGDNIMFYLVTSLLTSFGAMEDRHPHNVVGCSCASTRLDSAERFE